MTNFLDGPAAGITMELRRAPVFLRVVTGPTGSVDALDQRRDVAGASERIHVYQRCSRVDAVHLRRKDPSRGGYFEYADYKLVDPQPADADVRDNGRWFEWVNANRSRLLDEAATLALGADRTQD